MKGYLKNEPAHFLSAATCYCSRLRHTRGNKEMEGKNRKLLREGRREEKREADGGKELGKLRPVKVNKIKCKCAVNGASVKSLKRQTIAYFQACENMWVLPMTRRPTECKKIQHAARYTRLINHN